MRIKSRIFRNALQTAYSHPVNPHAVMLKVALSLTLTAFLCWFIILPMKADACGWWGDGNSDDDDESILVDSAGNPADDTFSQALIIDPAAQTREGDRYRTGNGVARDYTKALYWYRKAAELGFAGAQNNLAHMYEQGLGLSKNSTEAAKWFRKAAEQQDALAQHALGRMYRNGEGVPQNYEKAAKWIRRSAEQGHYGAFNHMGEMYWQGLGVSQDNVQACMWWKLGVLYGDKKSEIQFSMAVTHMTPEDVEKAENLAQEWLQDTSQ